MLRKIVGNYVEKILSGPASALHRRGITPNSLTVTGLIINGIGAYLYYLGLLKTAGVIILFAGMLDMLDGAVARAGNSQSKSGGFVDSVVDRYSDFLIFGGVLAFFARANNFSGVIITLAIICGSFMVSYVRARAELVIPKCDVGLLERPERIIILAAGSILNSFNAALWILAVFTHFTACYRIYYTLRHAH
ncbi:CDP-alcohol phosphatidyltransferase [uncultured Desulfobacterium sp.]|uniref:CDP-alcohol phosphatidyltransferase n=1 Tax=uncultured Desulfobacterium sp. TaxID=201089 RepID=A0A445N3K8_9BACT|nr:CDP-alcohol phosphatidyltransferase [uncultured Desulfobacterium sp.]